MEKIFIYTSYITLGQALKYAGIVCNGGEIREFLEENLVKINGVEEKRRGKKLFFNDVIEVNDKKYIVLTENESENEVKFNG